jgi:hypothetical protein
MKIQELSTRFGESFSNLDSLIEYIDSVTEIHSVTHNINGKASFLFQRPESLRLQIQSLTEHISLYLNQFDHHKINKFNQLYQLFGIRVKLEFSLNPNSFVLFVDSISEKIIQLHEKSNRYERALKDMIEHEQNINSHSLMF